MTAAALPATLWDLICARADATPDAPMLADERGRRLSFAGYRDAVARAAAGLHADGLRAGMTVAWQIPTRIETLVLMGALARLRARQVPLLPIYRERELTFCLRQTDASVFYIPAVWRGYDYGALAGRVREAVGGFEIRVLDGPLPDGDPAELPPHDPGSGDELRWVYYTSGTTSDPKGARHSDRTLIGSGVAFNVANRMTADHIYGVAFPFTHVGGAGNLCSVLAAGFSLVLTEYFDPVASTELFRSHGATMVGGGPAFYRAFVDVQRRTPNEPILPQLKFMTGGGAPMPPELHFEVKREIGGAGCAHGWGMTECCIIAINGPWDTDEHMAYTSGRPIDGVDVRIVDGELRIKGDRVFKGYLDEALNADAFDGDGYFRSGDLGELTADGYVVVTGRLKDIIIRKMENISAKEIEDLLYLHDAISDVAVIGLPDAERGERVCAVVCLDPGRTLTLADVVDYCVASGLMRQKIPEQLEIVEALPRNATGKILKHELRKRFTASGN